MIYDAAHRWPVLLAYILVGSLLGLGMVYLFPTPYQASVEIYVAVNVDAIYRNPDDYKNAILSELNTLALSEDVLQETLTLLRQQDPVWEEVDLSRLSASFSVNYRTAGKWRLAVRRPDSEQASQAAQTWAEVVFESAQAAIQRSRQLLDLDTQLQVVSGEYYNLLTRLERLESAQTALQEWLPGLDAQGQQPLDPTQRWQLIHLVSGGADFEPGWLLLLDQVPPPDAPALEYVPWVEQALAAMDVDLAAVQIEQESALIQYDELAAQREVEFQASKGLSAFLYLEQLPTSTQAAAPVRPVGLALLLGGITGILVWGAALLFRATRRPQS